MHNGHNADQDKALKTALHALQVASSAQSTQVQSAAGKSVTNTGAIVAGASIIAPSAADFMTQAPGVIASKTTRVKLSGGVFARHSAIDTAVTFQYIRDPAGAATPIGPVLTADSSHVNANATMTLPDFYDTPGAAVRIYAVIVATAAGTVEVLAANEACITATPTA